MVASAFRRRNTKYAFRKRLHRRARRRAGPNASPPQIPWRRGRESPRTIPRQCPKMRPARYDSRQMHIRTQTHGRSLGRQTPIRTQLHPDDNATCRGLGQRPRQLLGPLDDRGSAVGHASVPMREGNSGRAHGRIRKQRGNTRGCTELALVERGSTSRATLGNPRNRQNPGARVIYSLNTSGGRAPTTTIEKDPTLKGQTPCVPS